MAAKKFAECQKTIASLGQQLKSLASLEEFLLDSEKPLGAEAALNYRNGIKQDLQSNDLSLPKRDSEFTKRVNDCLCPLESRQKHGVVLSG